MPTLLAYFLDEGRRRRQLHPSLSFPALYDKKGTRKYNKEKRKSIWREERRIGGEILVS